MKSNYMKSAEIKIAKNPDMSDVQKRMLKAHALDQEMWLCLKQYGTYIKPDSYARNNGFNAQSYFIDELVSYEPQEYVTTTQLTRENLERLIDSVRATPAREPIYIGTRDGLDATLDAYRLWQTPTTTGTTIDWRREYTGTWEPIRNEIIAQINLPE